MHILIILSCQGFITNMGIGGTTEHIIIKRNTLLPLSLTPPHLYFQFLYPHPILSYLQTSQCSVVDISYQSVQLDLLRDYLGGLDDDSLSQLAASHGWQTVTREDGTKMMEIRKQEATIKPKKILAKIDFDSKLSSIRLLYLSGSVLFLPTM